MELSSSQMPGERGEWAHVELVHKNYNAPIQVCAMVSKNIRVHIHSGLLKIYLTVTFV